MRGFSITNDHLKTVVPAQAGIPVSLPDEMGLSATNLAGGGCRKHAAATHFLLLRQKKVSKERRAGFIARCAGSLRCSPPQATRTGMLTRQIGVTVPLKQNGEMK